VASFILAARQEMGKSGGWRRHSSARHSTRSRH
jgi:hypothetical protein